MKSLNATPTTSRFRIAGFVLSFLLAGVTSVSAQGETGTIVGRVIDAAGAPLSGAIVTIKETGRDTSTGRDGSFRLANVPPGAYTATVSYLGLPPRDVSFSVQAGLPVEVPVRLGEDVIELAAFTVEGHRAGQARALNEQRASDSLRNVVSSDALGRFPDQNAAETLQRINGISVERDQGEGRFVVIRGIDPDLNNTLMNGVALPGSEDDSRKVNLDVVPSDLIASIEVVKALTPDMDADAIGGSVNIKTLTAFDADGRVLRGSVEGQYSDLSGKWGRRVGLTWSDIFRDGTLGLSVSLSDQERTFGSDNSEVGDPWEQLGAFSVPGGDVEHREYFVIRQRQGANVSLDFKPSLEDSLFVRGVYNHFADFENRFLTNFAGDVDETTATSDETGTVVDRSVEVTLKDRWEDANILALSAGGEHRRGAVTVDYIVSYSMSELLDTNGYDAAFESGDTSWSYDFSRGLRPGFSGPGSLLAGDDFEFTEMEITRSTAQEEETAVAANVRFDTQLGGSPGYWKFGAKHRAKEKDVDGNTEIYEGDGAFTLADAARFSARGVNPSFPSIAPGAFFREIARNPGYIELEEDDTILDSTLGDYVTNEDVFALYGMGRFSFGNLTVLGGARYEQTKFKTSGWEVTDEDVDTLQRLSARRSYSEVLPSAHLRYDFTPRLIARASWTKSLARPKYPDSAFTREIDEDGNFFEGNPALNPYLATNWDATLEFYPESLGMFSVGLFRKEIDGFIFRQTLLGASPDGTDLTKPLNGRTAEIDGAELSWQQQLTFLPAPFDGLGLYANLTLTDSSTDLGAARPGEDLPFLKQSRRIANYAVAYEKNGIFLRVSANYRSAYLDDLGSDDSEDITVRERWQIDVSANYRLSDRYTVYAEFLNVTNEPFISEWSASGRLAQVEFYSWAANVGLKFNF